MKNFYYALLSIFLSSLMLGCGKNEKNNSSTVAIDSSSYNPAKASVLNVKIDARKIGPDKSEEQLEIENAIQLMVENRDMAMVGYWVGAFGKNKINVAVAGIRNGEVVGYTVCAGNYRPLSGQVENYGDTLFVLDMKEPGTEKYDGHFQCTIHTNRNEMKGKWSPFKKGAVSSKDFLLMKTEYKYRTDVGEYPEASSRMLNEQDVENLSMDELEFMRNEIYARHGYSFKDKAMRQLFDTTRWYTPMGIDIRDNLKDIEVQNIDLIYRYEKYYAENYDTYGR